MKFQLNRTQKYIAVAFVAVLGAGGFFVDRYLYDPYGAVLRTELKAMPIEKNPKSPYSDEYTDDMRRLVNQIARKSKWADDDAKWVTNMLKSGWPDIEQPDFYTNQVMYEAYSLYDMAITTVSERIGRGIPVPAKIEEICLQSVLDNLRHPQWYVRNAAVGDAYNAGLFKQQSVLITIKNMAAQDPNENVRKNAQRRLDAIGIGDG
ncbi:MAG: hypothetical protein ACWA5W_02985 [Phycisphaerales bacterium]